MSTKKPPRGTAGSFPKEGGDDRTVVTEAPQFTDGEKDSPGGPVFAEEANTNSGKRPSARAPAPKSSDMSVIQAMDVVHHLSHEASRFQTNTGPQAVQGLSEFGDGVLIEEAGLNPRTEVLSLPDPDPEEPVEVKKWRAAPDGPAGARSPARAFELPRTEAGVDGATRVEVAPRNPHAPDWDEVKRLSLEAAELVRSARGQAQKLDIEVGRGLSAQLSAALHRLNELIAKLDG